MTPSVLAFLVSAAILLALSALALHARPVTEGGSPAPLAGPSPAALKKLRRWIAKHVKRNLRGADNAASEDVTQEVLLVIVARWGSFAPSPGRDPLRRWAYGIARNAMREHRYALAMARAFEEKAALAYAVRVMDHSARDAHAHAIEARDLLRKLHAEMAPERWAVWFATVAEGYTAEEIAAREGVPRTTIEWRLLCARKDVMRVLVRLAGGAL